MTALAQDSVFAAFLVFCRIGGCLMLAPGIGGRHIPMRVRLFLALALALSFVPLLMGEVAPKVRAAGPGGLVLMVIAESATGAIIALLARFYFAALQFVASFIAQAVGVAGMPGVSMDDDEALPTLASLIAFSALALLFISDLHLELVRGLFENYARVPPGSLFNTRLTLVDLVDQLTAAFLVALRLASPFVLYAVVANFAVGLINRLTPQIPVSFIAGPFLTAGGLLLLYASIEPLLSAFLMAFGQWLKGG